MKDGHDPYAVLVPRKPERLPIRAAYRGAAWSARDDTQLVFGPPVRAPLEAISVRAIDMRVPGELRR